MPPVIANGGYYGAPGVTAAGAYGSTPADMLYSLRNQGWSDQQIMDVYGANDPMVRIMQLENRWNQTRPNAQGYRYQSAPRQAAPRQSAPRQSAPRQPAGPSMNTVARTARSVTGMIPTAQQPATQQPTQQNPVGSHGASPLAARLAQHRAGNIPPTQLTPEQQVSFERVVADPYQSLPAFGSFAPSYAGTADNYYAPQTGAGIRIRPWTDPITYGGSLSMPPMQDEPSLVDSAPQYGSMYMYTGPFSGPRRSDDFSASSLGQSIFNSLAQYR